MRVQLPFWTHECSDFILDFQSEVWEILLNRRMGWAHELSSYSVLQVWTLNGFFKFLFVWRIKLGAGRMLWPQWYSSPAARHRVMLYSKNKATWCKVCSVFRPNFLPLCVSGQPRSAEKELVLQIFIIIFQAEWTGNARSWLRGSGLGPRGRDTSHCPGTRIKSPVAVACAVYLCFTSSWVSSYISQRFRMNRPLFVSFVVFFP